MPSSPRPVITIHHRRAALLPIGLVLRTPASYSGSQLIRGNLGCREEKEGTEVVTMILEGKLKRKKTAEREREHAITSGSQHAVILGSGEKERTDTEWREDLKGGKKRKKIGKRESSRHSQSQSIHPQVSHSSGEKVRTEVYALDGNGRKRGRHKLLSKLTSERASQKERQYWWRWKEKNRYKGEASGGEKRRKEREQR